MTTTFIVIGALIVICLIVPVVLLLNEKQEEHSVLRNYPIIGKLRFIFEKIGPELCQYLFLNNQEELKRIRVGRHVWKIQQPDNGIWFKM